MSVKWHSSFDFIDGGSHFSVRFRFENLAFLYLNFRERRVRLVPFGLINFQLNLFSVPLCIQKELDPLLLLITLHSHNRYQSLMQLPEFKYFAPLLIGQ